MAFSTISTGAPPTLRTSSGSRGRTPASRLSTRQVWAVLLVAGLSWSWPVLSGAADSGPESLVVALSNARPSSDFSAVGLLLAESCPGGRCGVYSVCSGVLLGRGRFVTAAHCVENRDRDYSVFLRHGGFARVSSGGIAGFCDERSACDAMINDIAILTLERDFAGVSPAARAVRGSRRATITGFGDSGSYPPDRGVFRAAPVDVEPCGTGTMCHPIGGELPAPCNQDSGGAMFAPDGVIGIARRSEQGCRAGRALYVDLTTEPVAAWLELKLGPSRMTETDAAKALEVDCTTPECWTRTESHRHAVVLEESARGLLVTLNYAIRHVDHADGRREIRHSLTVLDPDGRADSCQCTALAQVAACECEVRSPGSWAVQVTPMAGRGPFQVTGRVRF